MNITINDLTIPTMEQIERAMQASDDLLIVRPPDPDDGTSRSRMQRKGLRRGWVRHVTSTRTGEKGAYQFEGDYVNGEAELPRGSLLLRKTPESGADLWLVVIPGRPWHVGEDTTCTPTLRRLAQDVLDDPGAAAREMIRTRLSEEIDPETTIDDDDLTTYRYDTNDKRRLKRIAQVVRWYEATAGQHGLADESGPAGPDFEAVRITISNEQGEVYAIHDIGDETTARYILHDLQPDYYECPEDSEPEMTQAGDLQRDMETALCKFLGMGTKG